MQDSVHVVGVTFPDPAAAGRRAYELATELFPICRSITGPGVRETLSRLRRELPEMTIEAVPSGTRCFDWTVPPEWSVRAAYIETEDGRRIVDFENHNLHVVGYSVPVDMTLSLEELRPHLHSLPAKPDAIPYVTSYYQERWGFCLSDRLASALQPGRYRVKIDSSLTPGVLNYGEVRLPGETAQEVLISTYVCHPSLANNELSGPVAATEIVRWLRSLPDRRYSYRIVFVPETIGSIVYLSRHLEVMKKTVVAGFNLTCIGDDRDYSYLASRRGGTLADRAALHALHHHAGAHGFKRYSFLDRGSDERQYCSPGVDLPMVSIMRSKYGAYLEYHTSLDDLSVISPAGLGGGIVALAKAILAIEANAIYRATVLAEPQMGRRGLYPTLSMGERSRLVKAMMNLLAYADGDHDLLSVAEMLDVPVWELHSIACELSAHGLLAKQKCKQKAEQRA